MLDDRPDPSLRRPRPFGGAAAVSLLSHAALLILAVAMHRQAPPPPLAAPERSNLTQLVFRNPDPRPGGGSSGGGDNDPRPARRAADTGRERVSVRTAPPPAPTPEPPANNEPPPAPIAPVEPQAADSSTTTGVPDPAREAATDSRDAGNDGGAGTGKGGAEGPGKGRGLGDGAGPGVGDGVFGVGNGVTSPRLLRSVRPEYTSDAMRARIQGTVALDCVVDAAGRVNRCLIRRSLDPVFGLDQQALIAARLWTFEPGMRAGQPVAVRVAIELAFTIR